MGSFRVLAESDDDSGHDVAFGFASRKDNASDSGSDVEASTREFSRESSEDGGDNLNEASDDLAHTDAERFREELGVEVRLLPQDSAFPPVLYQPALRFEDLTELGVSLDLVEDCKRCAGGAKQPTPVQCECWGLLLASAGGRMPREVNAATNGSMPEDIPVPDSDDDVNSQLQPGGTLREPRCMVRESLDLIGIAPTGSGKTLAYLLPMLADNLCRKQVQVVHLSTIFANFEKLFPQSFPMKQGKNKALLERCVKLHTAGDVSLLAEVLESIALKALQGKNKALGACWQALHEDCRSVGLLRPLALVLAPTRELVQQVAHVATLLGAACAGVVGGVDYVQQREKLSSEAPSLVVATPGRLLALCGKVPSSTRLRTADLAMPALPTPAVQLGRVARLVLDEADRLLDEGFEEDITALSDMARQRRLTLLFSATWSTRMEVLAAVLRPNAVHVTVSGVPPTINQQVELVQKSFRGRRLRECLRDFGSEAKVLVFVLFKKEAKELARMLSREGFGAWALEGNMSQSARMVAMQGFREARFGVLVATDVAARGLDVPDVTHVINFSLGLSIDSYVHRIGRCGRAGRKGKAVTFVTDGDNRHARQLVHLLEMAGQEVPSGLHEMAERYEFDRGPETHIEKRILRTSQRNAPRR